MNELLERLNSLTRKQELFGREINELREEIKKLAITIRLTVPNDEVEEPVSKTHETKAEAPQRLVISSKPIQPQAPVTRSAPTYKTDRPAKPIKIKTNIEALIGENIISKLGIIILILGVGIGTKYAIDHQLISPLTRIIMGYLVGLGLLGFAIKLKKKYDNFSAVLLSGAMAIMYFITFAAYNFFALIPQTLTFALMVVFTIFTVVAALNYNKQVIAHIGLVGAYAVPFLLSDGSGKVLILFSYMAIINIGILAIAFRKNWKPLNYVAFALTWLIFSSWYSDSFRASLHFNVAATFLLVFFLTFYLTFLAYKLIQKEKFDFIDVILILANSFVFFGIGYAILDQYQTGSQLLGLFTLGNAIVHFAVSTLIHKQKLGDRNLFYLISGLVLVFIAIAIPVQLDGNWVTLLWAGQAALLFWIGRTKKVDVYEGLSYALMALAFLSLFWDWMVSNNSVESHTIIPFINVQFLSSIFLIAAFAFILKLNENPAYPSVLTKYDSTLRPLSIVLSAVVLLTVYMTFFLEIGKIFDQAYLCSAVLQHSEGYSYSIHNQDIMSFKACWLINYSLLFTSMLSYINFRFIKNDLLTRITRIISMTVIAAFLIVGLFSISELREHYLKPIEPNYYSVSLIHIIIRYISLAFVGLTFLTNSLYLKTNSTRKILPVLLHVSILWILTSELISWMDIAGYHDSYKLGITILWGVYSVLMIMLGIWKQNKNLRIMAIVLFGITLAKLFLYDIASLDTISKTIVLVSLGILLLVISFLYNKYKRLIFSEDEN